MAVCCEEQYVHIAMELVTGKNLYNVLFPKFTSKEWILNEDQQFKIGYQISMAIAFIHQHPAKILHRDIKPENIMISADTKSVKLCDLGLGRIEELSSGLLKTLGKKKFPGSPFYMAPELFSQTGTSTQFSDVWALACSLSELHTKKRCWEIKVIAELKMKMDSKQKPMTSEMPKFLQAVINKSFSYDAQSRPTAKEILDTYVNYEKTKNNFAVS